MRNAWIGAFKEMRKHMNPEEMPSDPVDYLQDYYGGDNAADADEEEEAEDAGRQRYIARTITGFVRNRCSFNAAMNCQFQGPVAQGAKEALWNVYKAGLGDRMLQFIHDELLYCLYPEEVMTTVPIVESAMLAGMRKIIKHVKVGVETSLMTHWDKGAIPLAELPIVDGIPQVEMPAFVQEVMRGQYNNIR